MTEGLSARQPEGPFSRIRFGFLFTTQLMCIEREMRAKGMHMKGTNDVCEMMGHRGVSHVVYVVVAEAEVRSASEKCLHQHEINLKFGKGLFLVYLQVPFF